MSCGSLNKHHLTALYTAQGEHRIGYWVCAIVVGMHANISLAGQPPFTTTEIHIAASNHY